VQWLLRVVGGARPTTEEIEALRVYIRAEYILAASQGRTAEQFNSVVAENALAVLTGVADDAAKAEMIGAADQYVEALRKISDQHRSIAAPHRAAECFLAHELLYRAYIHWGEAQQVKYRGAPWFSPADFDTVKRADKALKEAKREADRQKDAIRRAARMTAADIMQMVRDADHG
jgi:enoyl-CoA hydratase/carnithine racemase